MLRRLNVRTRLVAVIAVPLVLLVAVAVPEAAQRWDRAQEADRAVAATEALAVVSNAIDALQAERTLTAAQWGGAGAEVRGVLEDQRTRSDAAIGRAHSVLLDLSRLDPALVGATQVARVGLDRLGGVRDDADRASAGNAWEDAFAPIIGGLLDVEEATAIAVAALGLDAGLRDVVLLERLKDAASAQAAVVADAAARGSLAPLAAQDLAQHRADEAAYRVAYLSAAPPDLRAERRNELAVGAGTATGRVVDDLLIGAAVVDVSSWLDRSNERQQVIREVEDARAAEALGSARNVAIESRRSATGYLSLSGVSLLLVLGLALAAARSITRPLRTLTDAADRLAQERLPALVDALRHPVEDDEHYLAAALEPIPVTSDDELGRLAHSFNAVQSVAVDVAAEQASLLKKGISDLYVNLARRNQALIERQIQLLDHLEASEEDAEVLEHLYLLDHLATRMRRNAESLLVLAGAESGPRRSKPVTIVDVVRGALSEVEEYARVEVGMMPGAVIHGPAVSDVAHLVAELLENAAQFSPPDTAVRVDGSRTGGGYQLVITDRGVGMTDAQLEDLNAVLSDPPVTGLALGRALGCLVAARLAARHGIIVRLRAGDTEGVAAHVIIPRHLLADDAAGPTPASEPPLDREAHEWDLDWADSASPSEAEPGFVEPIPAELVEALPTRQAFDAGLQALLERGEPTDARPVDEPAVATRSHAAHLRTGALRRRVPGATAEAPITVPDAPPVPRDPATVRAQLSRYRSGLLAGRVTDGPADEERS